MPIPPDPENKWLHTYGYYRDWSGELHELNICAIADWLREYLRLRGGSALSSEAKEAARLAGVGGTAQVKKALVLAGVTVVWQGHATWWALKP